MEMRTIRFEEILFQGSSDSNGVSASLLVVTSKSVSLLPLIYIEMLRYFYYLFFFSLN